MEHKVFNDNIVFAHVTIFDTHMTWIVEYNSILAYMCLGSTILGEEVIPFFWGGGLGGKSRCLYNKVRYFRGFCVLVVGGAYV
jgi:hypothetical protein